MNKTTIVMSLLLSLCLSMIIGCDDDITAEVPEAMLSFYPEYDYVAGYDISGSFSDVDKAFEKCNTDFWPYEDSEIPDEDSVAYFLIEEDMRDFVEKYAVCTLDNNGNLDSLSYNLYLAGVAKHLNNSNLGITLDAGQVGRVICMIFVERIREVEAYPQINYSENTLITGAVLHELGHGRADLDHTCTGYQSLIFDEDNHTDVRCVMGGNLDNYLKPPCAEEEDDSPFESVVTDYYCDSCSTRLSRVTWQ